ncbi:MAG: hypothetical protein Q9164_002302 [Protoblastenia rupestris]
MSSSSSRSSLEHNVPGSSAATNPLDALLPHLLASKRSLATIDQVYRANDLCTSTQAALEHSAVITARSSFLRSGITSQLGVLDAVQQRADNNARLVRTEFEDIVEGLDKAEKRLSGTLDSLRSTIVEAQLRPQGEERRCLLDFVDESGVEGLVESIRAWVKEVGRELEVFVAGSREFEDGLKNVRDLLDGKGRELDSGSLDTPNNGRSPIPEILGDMEEHAKEMAVNLESLVSHFDLCVTAIKHTEGGGDAALKIAGDLPDGVDIGLIVPSTPMSDEQRLEMMGVLEDDAGQVEDVVMEIRSHIIDMEAMDQRVKTHMNFIAREHDDTVAAFKMLEEIGQRLPTHITRNQNFLTRWDEARARIDERLEELENAKGFYEGFLRAYDNLIIEIGRRKSNEAKMKRVVQDAISSLEKLYEDDFYEREAFKKEQGEFLPVDIWPALLNAPTKFNVGPVGGVVEEVPDISKSVIHKAIRRIHGPT